MIWFLSWLIAIEAVAATVLPLTMRLFRPLPDRGYLFAKPLGVLLVGYLCWLLGVLGVLQFRQATIVAVLAIVAAGTWAAWGRETLKQLSGTRWAVLTLEAVFLIAVVTASVIRAYNPEISGTEKPMDFAFLNSLVRTQTLPPEDPWLSGYSISYYYFGYYLMAVIAKLAAVPAGVAYNLAVALVFSLLVAGSFSIAFNLLSVLRPHWPFAFRVVGALLAPVLVGVMGNLEIALEVLAAQGYSNAAFWQWVGIKNLHPAPTPTGLFPTDFWWWWRASRVIPTTTPDGINEFPYFSFLLGDLHPHYTALPWDLLAIAVSLAVILGRAVNPDLFRSWLLRVNFALVLGFLLVGNSWDFPTYTALFWVAALVPLSAGEWRRDTLIPKVKPLLVIFAMSIGLYSPFFLGFSSQTKGLGLSADRTPLASMLIIFGTVMFGLACFLVWRGWSNADTGGSTRLPRLLVIAGGALIFSSALGGSLTLLLGIALLGIAAVVRFYAERAEPDRLRAGELFQLLLIAGGIGLIVVPEFVFIMDLFGTRMNTVFKFHYQAWVLLGIATAVGIVWLVGGMRPIVLRAAVVLPFALLVGVGLLYPWAATPSKTQDFKAEPTLDGVAFFRSLRPDDYAAITWLARTTTGRPVVLEATGGSYTEYARVSTFSGLPTVLGWGPHEAQWGRDGAKLQQRAQDIDSIYSTGSQETALALLRRYNVQYVFVGSMEAEKYGPGVLNRFAGWLEPAYRHGRVAVYRVPPAAGQG